MAKKRDVKKVTANLKQVYKAAIKAGDISHLEAHLKLLSRDRSYTKAILKQAIKAAIPISSADLVSTRADLLDTVARDAARELRTDYKLSKLKKLYGGPQFEKVKTPKPNRAFKDRVKSGRVGRLKSSSDIKLLNNLSNHEPEPSAKTAKIIKKSLRSGVGAKVAAKHFSAVQGNRHFTKKLIGSIGYGKPDTRKQAVKNVNDIIEQRRVGRARGQFFQRDRAKPAKVTKLKPSAVAKGAKVLRRFKLPGILGAGASLAYAAYSVYSDSKAKGATQPAERQKAIIRKQIVGAKPVATKPKRLKRKAKPRERAGRYITVRSSKGKPFKRLNPNYKP